MRPPDREYFRIVAMTGSAQPSLPSPTPILETSPVLWLDSSYSEQTLVGTKISQLNDLIGSNHATQGIDANRPVQHSMGLVKVHEYTATSATRLTLPNSIKSLFRQSFTLTLVGQTLDGPGTQFAYFGIVDTSQLYVFHGTGGTLRFTIIAGGATVNLITNVDVIYDHYNITPIVINAVFDSTVAGIGGLKLYVNNVLQTDDGTNRGNTSTLNIANFDPVSIDFQVGARARVSPTFSDLPFGGFIQSVMLHQRVLTSEERETIKDFYVGT